MTISNAASVLSEHLTLARRRALDLTQDFSKHSPEQVERIVDRATKSLIAVMDAFPALTRQRRLTKGEWESVLAERASVSVELERRRKRFVDLANRLLGAQHKSAAVSDPHQGVSVVVDSRFRSAGVRGIGQRRMNALTETGRVSMEPDAGCGIQGTTGAELQARFGWEDELAVLISNDPDQPRAVPNIVVGFISGLRLCRESSSMAPGTPRRCRSTFRTQARSSPVSTAALRCATVSRRRTC